MDGMIEAFETEQSKSTRRTRQQRSPQDQPEKRARSRHAR
jgi:hypothetical protein